jgi:hypothetical protein
MVCHCFLPLQTLDPIIISDTMSSIYSDVLNVPSEILHHDAAVAYIECPNFTTSSFKREIWLYDRIDKETFGVATPLTMVCHCFLPLQTLLEYTP